MAGSGMMYTFGDTTTTKRTIANLIKNIDPRDVPCVSHFGTKNEKRFRMLNFPNEHVEWLEDTLRPRSTTLAEALDGDEAGVDVASGTGDYFKPGDVILVEDEKMWVSSISNDTLNVTRGWGDSSATSHSTSLTVTYLFSAREEGDESDNTYYTTPTAPDNRSQIFHAEILITGSEQDATQRYGITDQYKYQLMKWLGGRGGGNGKKGRAGDLMIDLEHTFFYGEEIARASGTAGAMGGVPSFLSTNVTDLSSAQLTPDALEDEIENCWSNGGKPNLIICNAFNKRLINSWYEGAARTSRTERTGGVIINEIETDFGTLSVMLNRWCPADEVYIVQDDLMGWVTLRDWFVEPLAKGGDYRKDQIIGEFSFVLCNEKAHARIHSTATS